MENLYASLSKTNQISQDKIIEREIDNICGAIKNGGPNVVKIRQRLLDLIEFYIAEEGEDPVSLGSIKCFLGFIRQYKPIYPDIVITMWGNIKAEWRESNNKLFTIDFYPNGNCKFLCFLPNSNNPNKVDMVGGQATADTVMSYAKGFGISELFINE